MCLCWQLTSVSIMERIMCTVLGIFWVLTVAKCSEKASENLCLDGFCGKRFIGVGYSRSLKISSKTCGMNQVVKINFNVTLRNHNKLNVFQTSINGSLFLELHEDQQNGMLIVCTELEAIMNMRVKWGQLPLVLLPLEKLGTEYFFSTIEFRFSEFSFVAVDNGTLVYWHYENERTAGCRINHIQLCDNVGGEKGLMQIDSMDVIRLEYSPNNSSHYDRIVSNKAIAVFGLFWTDTPVVYAYFQLKSVGMLGKQYFVYSPSIVAFNFTYTSVIKIVAAQNATTVTMSPNSSVMLTKTESASYIIKPHDFLFISSDKPILVFLVNSIMGILLPILAKEQYAKVYLLDLPPGKHTMFLVLPRGAEQHVQIKGILYNVSEISERNVGQNMITAILETKLTNGATVELSTDQKFGGLSVTTPVDNTRLELTSIECGLRRINKECRLETCKSAVCNLSAHRETCEEPHQLLSSQETSFRSHDNIVIGFTVVATGVVVVCAIAAEKSFRSRVKIVSGMTVVATGLAIAIAMLTHNRHYLNRLRAQR